MSEVEQVRQQIAQARTQVETAKQQAQEQRQLVEQKRQEAQRVEESLREQEKKIPKPTARLLRSGMFTGLEGRKRLRQVKMIEKGIGEKKGEVGLFKQEIEKTAGNIKVFETEIGEKEEEIRKTEGEVRAYEKEQQAIKLAERAAGGSMGAFFSMDSLARKYYRLIKQGEKVQAVYGGRTDEISIGTSPQLFGVKPIYSNRGEVVGVDDPFQKMSRLPTPTEKLYFSGGRTDGGSIGGSSGIITPSFSFSPPRDVPRTDVTKDWKPLASINFQQMSSSSSNLFNIPFRTTGSPMRVTKITSPKSRGYTPVRRIPKPKVPIRPIKIKTEKIKKKKRFLDKDEDSFLFGKKSKKIGKKTRKSIWGW